MNSPSSETVRSRMEPGRRRRISYQDARIFTMPSPTATALIFDLDNTLIRSAIDFLGLRHRLIDDLYTHGVSARQRDELVQLSLPELVALAHNADPTLSTGMWTTIGAAEAEGIREAQAVDHAGDVLETLRARAYRLAVLTNTARESVDERLAALNLANLFELVVTRSEGIALKPSPDGILYILRRLPGIEAAYMIGDAYIDGRAAEAAGIRFIGFGEKSAAVIARGISPWAWITDLRELLDLAL